MTLTGSDLLSIAVIMGYFLVIGIFTQLCKIWLKLPSEVVRKMYHIAYTMSLLLIFRLFSTWLSAVISLSILSLIFYIVLTIAQRYSFFERFAPERNRGEFRMQLMAAQLSLAILICLSWGLLGEEWNYLAVTAVTVWGFGDAAAAVVGKLYGKNILIHPQIQGNKTVEGTLAMFGTTLGAVFMTLLVYAGKPWLVCLIVTLIVAPISTVVELFSPRGTDTLTLPLATAVVIYAAVTVLPF